MAGTEYFRWSCFRCRYVELTAADELFRRLQATGAMKRAETPEMDVALELARVSSERIECPRCKRSGLQVEPFQQVDGFDDDWGPARPCVACGQPIPGERVTLFPDVELCAACQGQLDSGRTTAGDDYCPHCGTPMTMRKRPGAGLARYELVCTQCKGR